MMKSSTVSQKGTSNTNVSSHSYILANIISIMFLGTVMKTAVSITHVTDLLASYGTFHQDPTNQAIHFIGVPLIIWSAFIFLAHVKLPFLGSLKIPKIIAVPGHDLCWLDIVASFYVWVNVTVDKFGGTIYCGILYLMYLSAVQIHKKDIDSFTKLSKGKKSIPWYGTKKSLKFALFIHVIAWYIQIHPGHKIYEGASPAIMSSIGMALTAAPLFAFYEGLWLIGINKELQEQTLKLVDIKTKDLCEKNGHEYMRVCAQLFE